METHPGADALGADATEFDGAIGGFLEPECAVVEMVEASGGVEDGAVLTARAAIGTAHADAFVIGENPFQIANLLDQGFLDTQDLGSGFAERRLECLAASRPVVSRPEGRV